MGRGLAEAGVGREEQGKVGKMVRPEGRQKPSYGGGEKGGSEAVSCLQLDVLGQEVMCEMGRQSRGLMRAPAAMARKSLNAIHGKEPGLHPASSRGH